MEILLFWIIFAVVVGIAASNRGRSGFGWFLLSILLSPLLGLILVLVLPDQKKQQAAHSDAAGRRPCPRCGEQIMRSAVVCRFCDADLAPIGGRSTRVLEDEPPQGMAAVRDLLTSRKKRDRQ